MKIRKIIFGLGIILMVVFVVGCSGEESEVVANVDGEEVEIAKEAFVEKEFDPTGIYHSVIISSGFDPASLKINVGDGVEFTNDLERDFNLVFENGDFDVTIKTGQVVKYDFLKLGVVRYFEVVRPDVVGEIVVLDGE
jgi:plastocyanin